MNQYTKNLEKARRGKNMVVVYRDDIGGTYYAGVPVAVSPELAVLQKESGFRLDGYVALRPGDVTHVEQYDDNDFCRRALEGEGVYKSVAAPGFPCSGWEQLLKGVMQRYDGWLSVECEASEQTVYYVGRALSVENGFLTIKRVDADGRWHSQPSGLPLDEITLVTFGDNYLEVFRRYCR